MNGEDPRTWLVATKRLLRRPGRAWPAVLIAVAVLAPLSAPEAAALNFVEAQFDGVGGVDGLDYAHGVAVSPDGAHVYITGGYDTAIAIFARDGTTSRFTQACRGP